MDNQLKAITGLTIFIALGICCAGLIIAGPVSVPRMPARAAAPTIEPSATPTQFVLPTSTPTIEPIVFPTMRPTFTPNVTLALERYKEIVQENLTDLGNASAKLAPLMQQPRIGQDDWTIPVAIQFAQIQTAHDNLVGTRPPVEAEEFHAALISATADCSAATKQFGRGVDTLDREMLNSAGELLRSCGTKLRALPALD